LSLIPMIGLLYYKNT